MRDGASVGAVVWSCVGAHGLQTTPANSACRCPAARSTHKCPRTLLTACCAVSFSLAWASSIRKSMRLHLPLPSAHTHAPLARVSRCWDLPNRCPLRRMDTTVNSWHRPRANPDDDPATIAQRRSLAGLITAVEFLPASYMAVGFADGTVEVGVPRPPAPPPPSTALPR